MTGEPRDRRSGETMSEIIVQFGNELESDAVWTWQLVSKGRQGFGLEGDALADFMRCCIKELLSRGALPVYGGGGPHTIGSFSANTAPGRRRSWRTRWRNGWPTAPNTTTLASCGLPFLSAPGHHRNSALRRGESRNGSRLGETSSMHHTK